MQWFEFEPFYNKLSIINKVFNNKGPFEIFSNLGVVHEHSRHVQEKILPSPRLQQTIKAKRIKLEEEEGRI